MSDFLLRTNRAVQIVEEFLLVLAGIVTLVIMAVVGADVFMRYFMHRPFSWSYDFIGIYMVPLAFFLALSATFSRNTHISVDILYLRMNRLWQRAVRLAVAVATLPMAAWIVWLSAMDAEARWAKNEVISGAVRWPTWLPAAIVAAGFLVLTIRLVLDLVALLHALLTHTRDVPGESPERARTHTEVETL
ncbi:TRAP transporter small permease [Aquamicrobium sp. LC103]|uniref:TRAP transporter small permease subunit n=1 Tax=Aquamicrobium sp. LC103 TaxID=1120658 RepID=UPI000A7EEEA0|nr:TRAP transporter small permease [Aquamicrobium sp. LC103]